jgi:protein SCO1/2
MLRCLAIILATCLLAACGEPPHFNATDIAGSGIGTDFSLTDHTGRPRRLEDFRGKVVVVFFGFTHCSEACPATLKALADSMRLLGAEAARIQVLFVSLDPERDTKAALAQYVTAFDPSFLGLRDESAKVERVARAFKVFSKPEPAPAADNYAIAHSSGSYVFDPQGRIRLYINYGETPQRIADDLKLLLAGK